MSQLYTRVFVQILDSSIAEDYTLRHIFEDFLKVCDYKTGIVDMTRQALSRRLNVPLNLLNESIAKLESPDPASRDMDFEGRRLERLDDHRDWGWRILNWGKYERIRVRASGAERAARHRDKKQSEQVEMLDIDEPGLNLAGTIYDAYPKHVGRPKAILAITKAIQEFGYELVLEKTKAFARARMGQDDQLTPYPTTWFNQHRFNDDPSTWKQSAVTNATNKVGPKLTTQADAVNRQIREMEEAAARGMRL